MPIGSASYICQRQAAVFVKMIKKISETLRNAKDYDLDRKVYVVIVALIFGKPIAWGVYQSGRTHWIHWFQERSLLNIWWLTTLCYFFVIFWLLVSISVSVSSKRIFLWSDFNNTLAALIATGAVAASDPLFSLSMASGGLGKSYYLLWAVCAILVLRSIAVQTQR
jgi:hypothetical protein